MRKPHDLRLLPGPECLLCHVVPGPGSDRNDGEKYQKIIIKQAGIKGREAVQKKVEFTL